MFLVLRFEFTEIRRERLTDGAKELATMRVVSFGVLLIGILPHIKDVWFSSNDGSWRSNNDRVATTSHGSLGEAVKAPAC